LNKNLLSKFCGLELKVIEIHLKNTFAILLSNCKKGKAMKAVMSDKLLEILKDSTSRDQLREGLHRHITIVSTTTAHPVRPVAKRIKTRDAAYIVQLANVRG
jgi:hypothetical protein